MKNTNIAPGKARQYELAFAGAVLFQHYTRIDHKISSPAKKIRLSKVNTPR